MKDLKTLFKQAGTVTDTGDFNPEITGIFYNSGKVIPGGLFVAVSGFSSDGHKYIKDALKNGAAAVVGEKDLGQTEYPYYRVPDARSALASLSAAFYDFPSEKLKMAGVTGTNGKTSVTHFLRFLLEQAGISSGLLGTVKYVIGDKEIAAERTTPESADIQRFLYQMLENGNRAAVMEASSHGLQLRRLEGTLFDVAGFTNLSPEHLDFHNDMENYYSSKKKLFTEYLRENGTAVINIDDEYGERLWKELKEEGVKVASIGSRTADYVISSIKTELGKIEYDLKIKDKKHKIEAPLTGLFNVWNTALSLVMAVVLFPEFTNAFIKALNNVPQVPGRLEQVIPSVFVDYAHTPDALEKSLKALKFPRYSITAVFGAGGNRDRQKRPLMGKTASRLADKIILTNDNPRDEDPEKIIEDILAGISPGKEVYVVTERSEAIRKALSEKKANEILLIAGKGHEKYQEIKGERIPFDDKTVIEAVAEEVS